jgi:hypothetical protein
VVCLLSFLTQKKEDGAGEEEEEAEGANEDASDCTS